MKVQSYQICERCYEHIDISHFAEHILELVSKGGISYLICDHCGTKNIIQKKLLENFIAHSKSNMVDN